MVDMQCMETTQIIRNKYQAFLALINRLTNISVSCQAICNICKTTNVRIYLKCLCYFGIYRTEHSSTAKKKLRAKNERTHQNVRSFFLLYIANERSRWQSVKVKLIRTKWLVISHAHDRSIMIAARMYLVYVIFHSVEIFLSLTCAFTSFSLSLSLSISFILTSFFCTVVSVSHSKVT